MERFNDGQILHSRLCSDLPRVPILVYVTVCIMH